MDLNQPFVVAIGVFAALLVVTLLGYLARRDRANLHAIGSIPLPRHSTLLSGQPTSQIEAVFLDVLDTEHRRSVEGEPHYELYSAEQVAELRVVLFERAFTRREPRILFEIEVGVPLLRKLEAQDEQMCEWAQKRLNANPPAFGEPDSVEDLILKPERFAKFLWEHAVGASQVLFLEEVFHDLPITIVPRAVRLPALPPEEGTEVKQLPPPAEPSEPEVVERGDEHLRELVTTLERRVDTALGEGDVEARAAVTYARSAVSSAAPRPKPEFVCEFLKRLDRYEDRLGSFEAAFAAETSKPMEEWAQWVQDALAQATAAENLGGLGDDAVFDAFKNRARYAWITSNVAASPPAYSKPTDPPKWAAAGGEEDEAQVIDAPGEVQEVAPVSSGRAPERSSDKGAEMGF